MMTEQEEAQLVFDKMLIPLAAVYNKAPSPEILRPIHSFIAANFLHLTRERREAGCDPHIVYIAFECGKWNANSFGEGCAHHAVSSVSGQILHLGVALNLGMHVDINRSLRIKYVEEPNVARF